MLLTKDQIKQLNIAKHEDVEIDEWGGLVRIRILNAKSRVQLSDALVEGDSFTGLLNFVSHAVIDEQGEPMFAGDDSDVLAESSFKAFDQLSKAVLRVNGVDIDSVEIAEKNS